MQRKLFCEYNGVTYQLSVWRHILKRRLKWVKERRSFANHFHKAPLQHKLYGHRSLIRRRLGKVEMVLQENKATNLALAKEKIDGIVIAPGQKFSFWYLVGSCTEKKGYREGLMIKKGLPSRGIGGGLCQLTNLLHWLVLNSPLTIVEHHHHQNIDLFPDYGRQIPFGTGTSIMYNYLDYQFVNHTRQSFQLRVLLTDQYLCGELRSDQALPHSYHIQEENHYFSMENGVYYRNNEIVREIFDKRTGKLLNRELLTQNHARVMYDKQFIPENQVKSYESIGD